MEQHRKSLGFQEEQAENEHREQQKLKHQREEELMKQTLTRPRKKPIKRITKNSAKTANHLKNSVDYQNDEWSDPDVGFTFDNDGGDDFISQGPGICEVAKKPNLQKASFINNSTIKKSKPAAAADNDGHADAMEDGGAPYDEMESCGAKEDDDMQIEDFKLETTSSKTSSPKKTRATLAHDLEEEENQFAQMMDGDQKVDAANLARDIDNKLTRKVLEMLLNDGEEIGIVDEEEDTREENQHDEEAANTKLSGTRDRCCVRLLNILRDNACPLEMYDTIMNWAAQSQLEGHDFQEPHQSRKTVVKRICKGVGEEVEGNAMPKKNKVHMQGGGTKDVVTFDFETQLKLLLSDPRIFPHLLINWQNPSNPPVIPEGQTEDDLNEIHTGQWYKKTHQARIQVHGRDVLCGVLLGNDRTHCEKGQTARLSLEPVIFSLTIIPQWLRQHPFAWRPLGFVSNLMLAPSAEINLRPQGQNVRNIHLMLSVILKGLKKVQDAGGFDWEVTPPKEGGLNHGVENKVVLKLILAICLVLGDCKGHDVLCGRFACHTGVVKYLDRDCDCEFEDADDPWVQCTMRDATQFKALLSQEPSAEVITELRQLGQHYVKNVFYDMDVGVNSGNIHTMTPWETLHGLEKGAMVYAMQEFFGLLTDTETKHFDSIAASICDLAARQSDRSFPRVSFPNGFSNCTLLKAHENYGSIFISLLVLRSQRWMAVQNSIQPRAKRKRLLNFAKLFERLLLLHGLVKSPNLSRAKILSPAFKTLLRKTIGLINDVLRREEGVGLKLTKLHQIVHLVYYILEYGSPENWNSAIVERAHPYMCKRPGTNTQRHADTFEEQSALRLAENMNIAGAAHIVFLEETKKKAWSPEEKDELKTNRRIGGSHFTLLVEKLDGVTPKIKKVEWSGKDSNTQFAKTFISLLETGTKSAASFVAQACFLLLPEDEEGIVHVPCFTEHKRDGVIFRGSPCYRGGLWNDSAYFEYLEGNEEVHYPARIEFFVDLSKGRKTNQMTRQMQRGIEKEYLSSGPGLFSVAHCTKEIPRKLRHQNGSIKSHIISEAMLEDRYRLISVDAISDAVYMVDDTSPFQNMNTRQKKVHVIEPPCNWGNLFLDLM